MRTYERSGVTIDQCGECRGIFLDRGELEKLFEAEASWNRSQGAPAPGQPTPAGYPPPPPGGHGQPGYAQPGHVPQPPPAHYPPQPAYGQHGGSYGYHGHKHHKKRHKGFLGELFD